MDRYSKDAVLGEWRVAGASSGSIVGNCQPNEASGEGILFGTTHLILPIPLRGTEAYLGDSERVGDGGEPKFRTIEVFAHTTPLPSSSISCASCYSNRSEGPPPPL